MKISRPVLINVSLGVVILAVIVGGLVFLLPKTASGAGSDTTQLTSTVQQGVVSTAITATGQITAVRQVDANFATAGTVASVDVKLGDTVTAGQQLGTIATSDLSAALTKAQKSLSQAKASRASAQAAVNTANAEAASSDPQIASQGQKDQSSANSQLTSAQNQVDTASDAVTAAAADLASATLTSPIAGLVIGLNGVVGASSGSSAGGGTSTAFATIADVSAMTMTANIAEADIADVEVGQAASITFPALTDVTATATVTAIAPTATASNSVVTYATTITLDAIPQGLRLGQTAEVAITVSSSADDALYVPSAAITTATDGTSTVDVVETDGTVTTTTVTLGVVGDQGTEITTGLTLGQTIVLGEVSNDATDTTTTDTGNTRGNFGGFGGGTPPTGGGNFGGAGATQGGGQ